MREWMVPAPNTGPAPRMCARGGCGAPGWALALPAPSAASDVLPLVPRDGGASCYFGTTLLGWWLQQEGDGTILGAATPPYDSI
eukprot:scaffold2385_cov126-Isochrysis_galbana.AAC.5